MLDKVVIRNFKKFETEEFNLSGSVVLAGPNNSGKSTLLQAIAVWNLGFQKWARIRGDKKNYTPTKVPITRQEFTALPLREMNLMWFQKETSLKGKEAGYPKLIDIELYGDEWKFGMEFRYAGSEMVYAGPLGEREDIAKSFNPAERLTIVQIPCFLGIETEEAKMDMGLQNALIGKGRPGEILHNLLWEIYNEKQANWEKLVKDIEDIFGYRLLPPVYSGLHQAFITCEYLPGIPPQKGRRRLPKLNIANAGGGMHQVLLLLSFFYSRPASIFLLDEPDAHLHFILQREILDRIRLIAKKQGCQLIIATHSEVLLDDTPPEQIISFIGKPKRLFSRVERDQLREALKKLSNIDLLRASQVGGVLYVENESDYKLLREWAKILGHPACKFLENPFVHKLGGGSIRKAKEHLFALKAVYPEISGVCILDGDNKDEPEKEITRIGLHILRWGRYEIENYLLIPAAIKRYIDFPLFESEIDKEFAKQVPEGTDYFGDHAFLSRIKASEEFLPQILDKYRPTPKSELFLLAATMKKDEIHPEIREKLDAIEKLIQHTSISL
ncbi:MAG: AAA family ATPase [bacterium]